MSAAPLAALALSRAERDRQFSPSLSAKDAGGTLSRHAAETATLWDDPTLACLRDRAYDAAPRCRYDLVRPAGPGPFPCLAFLHGGFWQEGDKGGSGLAARALARRGWASALIGYTLAPEARLSDIVAEAGQAVVHLAEHAVDLHLDPARLVVAGHSAGAHLAAALLCGKAGPTAAGAMAGVVLISGVYDLEPVAASYVNDRVGMDAAEVRDLSLLDARPPAGSLVLVLVGADEPPAFQEQSEALYRAWSGATAALSLHRAPGRDHFDILDELADPDSPTFAALTETDR